MRVSTIAAVGLLTVGLAAYANPADVLSAGASALSVSTVSGPSSHDVVHLLSRAMTCKPDRRLAATSADPTDLPPDFPPDAAAFLEVTHTEPTTFVGQSAYQLTLSPGTTILAVSGDPHTAIVKILKSRQYSENASLLYRAGPYIVFIPSVSDLPEAFLDHVGPAPGMIGIDTDPYRCADPTIPGHRAC